MPDTAPSAPNAATRLPGAAFSMRDFTPSPGFFSDFLPDSAHARASWDALVTGTCRAGDSRAKPLAIDLFCASAPGLKDCLAERWLLT